MNYSKLSNVASFNEVIDVNALINLITKDFIADIERTQAVITVNGISDIIGNNILIHQLFHNLIDNALKYCAHDKVGIKIDILMEEEANYWKFSIRDNGIGIDESHQEKIFKAFQRLNHSSEYEGRGLGLDLSRKIVELHNGRIWVDSQLGNGSNFQFTITKPASGLE